MMHFFQNPISNSNVSSFHSVPSSGVASAHDVNVCLCSPIPVGRFQPAVDSAPRQRFFCIETIIRFICSLCKSCIELGQPACDLGDHRVGTMNFVTGNAMSIPLAMKSPNEIG